MGLRPMYWTLTAGPTPEGPCLENASLLGILRALRERWDPEYVAVRPWIAPRGAAAGEGASGRREAERGTRDGGQSPSGRATPVHILTGYLGSGKTTLLNALLRDPRFAGSAVIVNELGEIGIDHWLVERSDDRLVELAGGCVCCAVREDLAETLLELLERREQRRVPPFSRVIVETTGVADPVPVLNLLAADPVLVHKVRSGAVVTVVDAAGGAALVSERVDAARQAALADALVISKTDLAPGSVAPLERLLAELNPGAARFEMLGGPADLASGLCDFLARFEARAPSGAPMRRLAASQRVPGPNAGGRKWPGPGHRHVRTTAIVCHEPIPAVALALFSEALAHHLGPRLLRLKGRVRLRERPDRAAVVQGARHVFHPIDLLPLDPDGADSEGISRLVLIVEGGAAPWAAALLELLVEESDAAGAAITGRTEPTSAKRRAEGGNPCSI